MYVVCIKNIMQIKWLAALVICIIIIYVYSKYDNYICLNIISTLLVVNLRRLPFSGSQNYII